MITEEMIRWILILAIAGICGSIAQRLTGGKGVGCLASIVLGFIGALLGPFIAEKAGLPLMPLPIAGVKFPIIWAVIGASLFAAVLAFLSGSNRRSKD